MHFHLIAYSCYLILEMSPVQEQLNPLPFSVFRHLRQQKGGGEGCDPPGVSKHCFRA